MKLWPSSNFTVWQTSHWMGGRLYCSLPRRPAQRRSPGVQNHGNQASSLSTLRRRAAVENLVQEARYESSSSNDSGAVRDTTNPYQLTVEVEEEPQIATLEC